MSTNDPPGFGPDGGDDAPRVGGDPSHSLTNPASAPRSQAAEMDDLSERFSQQQVMISQLKEMVMAEEAARNQKIASARLKMEKSVSQLAKIRDRAKGSRLRNTSDTPESSVRSTPSMSVEPDSRSSVASSVTAGFSPQTSSSTVTLTTTTITSTSTGAPTVMSVPIKSDDSTLKLKNPRRDVTKMLHQQIQGHKAKIAETAKHERELEEALARIQKQLVENQNQSAEILQLGQTKPKVAIPSFALEDNSESNKIINELKNRITQLEGTILDLQETCKEKDSVIDSKTKAITLMSADLSKKGKNTLDLLDDTKEQMQQMQQNFATMEGQMKDEKQRLFDELETSKNRIFYLEEANSILETERFNLSIQNSFLEEQLAEKEKEINRMKEDMVENMKSIEELSLKADKSVETSLLHEEKGSIEISQMNALSEKIEILEKLNLSLRQSNIELQEKISSPALTGVKEAVKQTKEESPKPSRKGKTAPKPKGSLKYKNLNPKVEPPSKETTPPNEKDSSKEMQDTIDRLQLVIETLNKQVLEKEILLSQKEATSKEIKETSFEKDIEEAAETSQSSEALIESSESQIVKSEISDVSIASVDSKTDLNTEGDPVTESDLEDTKANSIEAQLEDALREMEKLTAQLVDANKSMIKVKAAHKKELKQMQKTIDDFSKVSNTNTEVVKLQGEVSSLTQKIAELEDDKGNLQLHLVDYDSGRVSDSQLHAKLVEMENLAEERLKAIAELETQKFDLVQELHGVKQQLAVLEDKVADLSFLENEHVSAELKSAQLEEQIDVLQNKNVETLEEIDQLKAEKESILTNVEVLNKEKIELNSKLEMYIQENVELIEKLDKLSAEKVSSAESIEMVESLTSQEKMEIEQYQKGIEETHMDKSKSRDEVEESLRRNSFSHSTHVERTDLPSNIDIINQERHEFMDKLDSLKIENSSLSVKMEELLNEKKALEDTLESFKSESSNFSLALNEELAGKSDLLNQIEVLKQENSNLSDVVKSLSAGKETRTEQVVVSETVEIEQVSEKEIIHPVSSSQSGSPKEVGNKNASKTNKNQTKEILRLKNLVKQQDSQIESLNNQITQLKEETTSQPVSFGDQQADNIELENALEDNRNFTDEMKNEKELFNQKLVEAENVHRELLDDKERLTKLIETYDEKVMELESKVKSSDGVIASLRSAVDQHKNDMDMLNNIMQGKDDEIAQCRQDIEQLDAVSRKLKSTLSQIEDEKSASIHNVDKIKELENNVQKCNGVIHENELKIKELERKIEETLENEELLKAQIKQHESTINERIAEIENDKLEIKKLNDEKVEIVKDISKWKEECGVRDVEMNEMKLQFRKECIAHDEVIGKLKLMEENNSLLNHKLIDLEKVCDEHKSEIIKQKENYDNLDKKSKEQFDKLKKFAANFKKKSALCTELEAHIESMKAEINQHVLQLEEANLKVQQTSQELSVVNSQFSVVQTQLQQSSTSRDSKDVLEKQVAAMQNQIYELQNQIKQYEIQIESLNATNNQLSNSISSLRSNLAEADHKISALSEENISQSNQIHDYRTDLHVKNEELSKINNLEVDLHEKDVTINNLTELIDETKSLYNQFKCGQEAKLQEKDIYIENLESELIKHKDRILRLEDSVSTMEERRASLERKTDHLVNKLNEKNVECSESSIHEDELEKRLIALMEHDDLIQKQLKDTEQENVDLTEKLNSFSESSTAMRNELDSARVELNTLRSNMNQLNLLEEERTNLVERVSYLEGEIKRINSESSEIIKQKMKEYEYLETELHSLMNNTEIQRRLSKEEFDKLQDEMSSQSQLLKDLQQENNWLKAENESISLQKSQADNKQESASQIEFVHFADSGTSNQESEAKINELKKLLDDKDKQINAISIKLQLASSGDTSDAFSKYRVNELEAALTQKNKEVEYVDSQFKSCLAQLTDAIESEKVLKQTVADLSKEINSQVDMVHRLEREIAELNASKGQYKHIQFVNEPIYQANVVEVVAATKVRPRYRDRSTSPANLGPEDLKALEDQIISSENISKKIVLSDIEKKMVRHFEHDPPEPITSDIRSYFQSTGPADEDFIQPKKAFECYKGKDESSSQPFMENPFDQEEGWGWSSQNIQLDDQHLQAGDSVYLSKVTELETVIQLLTDEKMKISADLTQSQQKTTKALLKLKEFKTKNEALVNEIKNLKLTFDFNMLDMTIQDELASQIKTLEEKIAELTSDAGKEKLEKHNLLKRIDVLTSANERLMEMKEKQDIEMQICKNQNKGLNEKIKNLDWNDSFGDDNQIPQATPAQEEDIETVSEPQEVSNAKDIIELIKKIQDLEADNKELQAFIEEQETKLNHYKNVELDLVKLKNQSAFEIDELKQENETLKHKLIEINDKCNVLESTINLLNVDSNRKTEISDDTEKLKYEISQLQEKVNKLDSDLEAKNKTLLQFDDVRNENIKLQSNFDELYSSYISLAAELQMLNERDVLQTDELKKENDALKNSCNNQMVELDGLHQNIKLLTEENANLKQELLSLLEQNKTQHLEMEVVDLTTKLEALVKEYYEFQDKFNELATEKDRIEIEYNNVIVEKDKLNMLYTDVFEQEGACKTELIKLSYEKDELAEKYDKLLNKLSEKNVGEETEQSIILTDKLNNLTQELNQKNADIIELNKKLAEYETEKSELQMSFNKLQEENNGVMNSLTELRNSINEAVDQRGMEVAEIWKQHVAMREAEFTNIEQALRQELTVLQSQVIEENLQKEFDKHLEQVPSVKDEELSNLKYKLQEANGKFAETKQQLEYTVTEKDKLKDYYEDQLIDFKEKCLVLNKSVGNEEEYRNRIVGLTSELDNVKTLYNSLLANSEVNVRKGEHDSALIAAKDKEVQDCAIRIQQVNELFTVKLNDYESALTNKETELDNVRQQLYIAETKLSDSVHEHEAELADMRLKLHAERIQYDQIISDFKDKIEKLELQLETKINECKDFNLKIESMFESENIRMHDLQKALESQEIEIVTLKENLIEQAENYEKIIISHMQEIHKLKANRHVTFSEETKPGADVEEPSTSADPKDYNPARAELDLALYMLHQRDVRCEELTMELTQLLEERDTLQLKLSNSLRASEELRAKLSTGEKPESREILDKKVKPLAEDVRKVKNKDEADVPTPGTSTQVDKSLETKISQLHKVGHMRDIRLRDEREHRMRQMELLQRDLQHLPPEAAARLREAHYTLTRDTQSASTVLLNWLWGKTTPKVVHM